MVLLCFVLDPLLSKNPLAIILAITKSWACSATRLLSRLGALCHLEIAALVLIPVEPYAGCCFLTQNLAITSSICSPIIIIIIFVIQGISNEDDILLDAG